MDSEKSNSGLWFSLTQNMEFWTPILVTGTPTFQLILVKLHGGTPTLLRKWLIQLIFDYFD